MRRTSILMTAILLLFAGRALAQGGGNAAITGTVTDPSGAVIPSAKVTVTQQGTSAKRLTQTNSSGQFTVPSLRPASYSVSVEAAGFKTYATQITLLADEARALDIQMQVGQTSESITVEAASVNINTVTPVLSQVVEQSRVVDLPLNGRNAADLTLLVPGTTGANGHGVQQGSTKQIPGTESISVNGARPDQISYNLDGASNEDLLGNTNAPFPFPDAVQEFSVQTNSFDAQYGTNAGAVVNVVTKSGTNQFHGDAFEFVRNKSFNARNAFSPVRDPLKRNQFGGTIGGPVMFPKLYHGRDKSWFFFGYQGTRIRTAATGLTATLPTLAELKGDFSAYLNPNDPANVRKKVVQIIDPQTGQPFPGNIIPQNRISPVTLNMAQFLPVSRETPDGRVTFSQAQPQNVNSYVGRFDQIVRGQDRLFVRAQIDKFDQPAPFDGTNLLTIGNFGPEAAKILSQNYAVGYTTILSSNKVNNLTGYFFRTAARRNEGNVPTLGSFGVNLFQLPQGGIRSFSVSGFFNFANFTDASFNRNQFGVRDNFSWTKSTHTIAFGGEWERDQSNIRNTDLEDGSFNFTNDTTNLALASFVLGHLRSFSQTSGNISDSRQNVWGLYVSDQWKFRPHLSFDLGLRWEPQVPTKEIRGRIEQFFPDAFAAGVSSSVIPTAPPGLFFIGDQFNGVKVPSRGEAGDYNNFAPRAGFAWNPMGGRTVVRGGGGIFYTTRLSGLFLNDASIIQPFSLRIDLTEGPNLGPFSDPLAFNRGFQQGFPQRFSLDAVPANVPFTPPVAAFGLQPGTKFVTPRTYQWNLTVERQLRSDTIFRVSYVALRGKHLREDFNLNAAQFVPGNNAFNNLSTDQRRPFQGFANIIESHNDASSSFNALETTIEKRPGPGSSWIWKSLTLLASYTYSKAMDIGLAESGGITDVGSSVGAGIPRLVFGNNLSQSQKLALQSASRAFETGPSDFDHTHSFVGSWTWTLPQMKDSSSTWARWVLGGWQATGIFTARSGNALTITAGKDQSKTNLGEDRADFIGPLGDLGKVVTESKRGGCAVSGPCKPFLDTADFALPAVGTFGNLGKGRFRGPSRWNADMGFFKNFGGLRNDEAFHVQFRAEFLNIFNHTEFNDPNTNFSSSTFGGIRGAADPRIIQLALKLFF